MRVNIYATPRDDIWSFTATYYRAYEYFKNNAPDGIEIVLKDRDEEKKIRGADQCWYGGCKFGPFYFIIENDETKKYILVSYWDKISDVILFSDGTAWDYENCVEIITSSGVHDPRLKDKLVYTPFTFLTTSVHVENQIEELYRSNIEKSVLEKPTFKGMLYDFREYLNKDERFDVTHRDLHAGEYIANLATQRLSIGLHGAGETCPRDMEILGLGNALLRKKFVADFHNPLIPDYHYAAIEWEDIIANDATTYWRNLADRYIERYEQIKYDDEYLHFIATNGRKWYEENATIDANVRLMAKLVDFNKLR